jgi:2-keto-4-pentenoate hydratase/2-oxohepta-3-ene-1,7-dioic acid hydratase in catechol pathway
MKSIIFSDGSVKNPGKIVCVGRNYAKHIEEMQSERTSDPVLFLKPNSALHPIEEPLPLLRNVGAVHHEIELAVCIGKTASNIQETEAVDYIAGYGLALDLTLRDMQAKAKQGGLPWAVAKGFDNACPISPFVPASQIEDPHQLNLILKINGEERQHGTTAHMLFRIPELLAYASRFFTFEQGDLLLTGTPAGVGPLLPGDRIEAHIDEIGTFTTHCI